MKNNKCKCGGTYYRIKQGCCSNKFMCSSCGKIKKKKRRNNV